MKNEIEDIYTWPHDVASIFLRYFLLAGVMYFIFYVWKQKSLNSKKIQHKSPRTKIIRNEILYSILTLIIYCITSWLVFQWQKAGITKIYIDINSFGYRYFALSIIIMLIVHDTYFYWTHRFLHVPKIFKWIHKTHHYSENPTPWAAFSFHPLEAFLSVGIIPIIVFLVPCHPYAVFIFLTIMTLINVLGHLGYELYSDQFIISKIGKWQNTSTNHNIHHQKYKYNFGLYFTFWDRIMGTYAGKAE